MRVPLVPKGEVNSSQKPLYDAFTQRIGSNYSSFKAIGSDGALLGPWSVWLQIPKTGETIRQYIDAVDAMPGLSRKAGQVVTLVVAAHFNAAYEIYAHAAVAAGSGLSVDQIATLCAGEIPADLDAESILAAKVAHRLLKGGVLPDPLAKHAVEGLGLDGFNRVVFLTAQYCLVSITLNAFDVPAEA